MVILQTYVGSVKKNPGSGKWVWILGELAAFVMVGGVVGWMVWYRSQEGEKVAETPPPATGPYRIDTLVFSQKFDVGRLQSYIGTGSAVRSPSGRTLAVTAAHMLEP